MPPLIRRAVQDDEQALADIDRDTWASAITPQVSRPEDRRFFGDGNDPQDVLVAVLAGEVVGYASLQAPTSLASNRHVLEIRGLAVRPAHQRRGIARQLLEAVIEEARTRGIRRLRLRVLSTNPAARRLYASLGFEREGVLREEFLLDGEYVDDVLMAIAVDAP
jgi:ribosomal protein S18 acetylase RimI-like enzyme